MTAGLLTPAAAQQAARAQIYATVIGDQGDPVRGLQSADLVLRDGGVRQGVLSAEPATEPLSVAVVVNGLTAEDLADATRAIEETVRALTAQDSRTQVGLVTDGSRVTLLTAAMPGLDGLVRRAVTDAPSLVESVIDAAEALRPAPADRRVVLAIARPPSSAGDGRGPGADRLALTVSGLHVALWTIEVGVPETSMWSPSTQAAIADACRLGGSIREHARTHGDIPAAMSRITNLLLSQYLVTYTWPDPMLAQFNLVTRHEAGRVLVPAWSR